MVSLLKRYRELIIISGLLLYPFASFLAKGQAVREPNYLDRAVLYLSSPLQRGLIWAIDGTVSTWRGYVALRGVYSLNLGLKEESRRLRAENNELSEARAENERLKRMLAYTEANPGQHVFARVLGVNPVSTLLSLRIDRGEADGVRHGMPVVTPDGVVGQVQRATGNYSDVVLVTDQNSRIGIKVQRSRVRATAQGRGDDRSLRLENALRTDDFREGDQVLTSGTDGVFPPGLVVGTITTLQRQTYGMVQTAEIAPAVNMTKLEEVLVIKTTASPSGPTVPQARRASGSVP
jgi:rod shape-determining protein MreC